MSIITAWYVAGSEAVDAIVNGKLAPTAYLDDIGEMELLALGEALGVTYEPELAYERGDEVVLRVSLAFLGALAAVEDRQDLARRWAETAEHLVELDPATLEPVLVEMQRCARLGLEGPGVLAVPAA